MNVLFSFSRLALSAKLILRYCHLILPSRISRTMSQKAKAPKSKRGSASEKSDASQEDDSKKKSLSASKRKPQENKSKSKVISDPSSSETSDADAKKRKMQEKKAIAVDGDLLGAVKKSRLSVATSVSDFKFNKKRVRLVSPEADLKDDALGVVYWMSRDQRVEGA